MQPRRETSWTPDFTDRQFVRQDDPHAALVGGDEDEFGAAADDANLEGDDRASLRCNLWHGYLLDSAAGISRRVVARSGCQSHHRQHDLTMPVRAVQARSGRAAAVRYRCVTISSGLGGCVPPEFPDVDCSPSAFVRIALSSSSAT
jgi:hypothetical protein